MIGRPEPLAQQRTSADQLVSLSQFLRQIAVGAFLLPIDRRDDRPPTQTGDVGRAGCAKRPDRQLEVKPLFERRELHDRCRHPFSRLDHFGDISANREGWILASNKSDHLIAPVLRHG